MLSKIDIRPHTYIYIVVLLFLAPLKWILAWLLAAAFHEMCHIVAVKFCDGEIQRIIIGLGGTKIECSALNRSKSLLAVLSGPLGGLLPLLFARWIPRTAFCCWVLSIYNLLPLLHLDGGRAVEIVLGTKALIIENLFLIFLSIGALYISCILHFGPLPLCVAAFLWLKKRNTPCKRSACKLQ